MTIYHPFSLAVAAFVACVLVLRGGLTIRMPDKVNVTCFLIIAAMLAFNVFVAVSP